MKRSVFEIYGESGLPTFLDECGIDDEKTRAWLSATSLAAIRYYSSSRYERESLRPLQELEAHWYATLDAGAPDYSVYNDLAMIAETYACWSVYSRKYLMLMRKPSKTGQILALSLGSIGSVIDLGCGIGFTTAALKECFVPADVYGVNLQDTHQWRAASRIALSRRFSLMPDIPDVSDALVFASEFFEHIEAPIAYLARVLKQKPKALIIANSFGSTSIGHFRRYLDGSVHCTPKEIGRRFGKALREHGYQRVKTGFWNDRPSAWKRASA